MKKLKDLEEHGAKEEDFIQIFKFNCEPIYFLQDLAPLKDSLNNPLICLEWKGNGR